jgi:asparagine synthase (glutamine-hydrolysing)
MCGIAGKLSYDAQPIRPDLLAAMTDAVTHRGPDSAGYYFGEGVGLGHRRLSIIDLSTGDQPLANEDETVWVVFNGEIYNFIDVPDDIRFTGALPKTRSGKIMRRLLRDIAAGKETVGDTTTLEDYSVLAKLRGDEE